MPRREVVTVSTLPPTAPTRMARMVGWLLRAVNMDPVPLGDYLRTVGEGARTASGVVVTEHNALTLSAVWAAVQVISGSIASLPLHLYKRLPNGGKERMTDHPLYRILHDQPNSEMTSMVFRETLQGHVLTWGNAYAEIERLNSGQVGALWPLTPDRVNPDRVRSTGQLVYDVWNASGSNRTFRAEQILHLPGLGWDGTKGYSVIGMARESLGLMKAAEKFGAEFFARGARASGTFEHPQRLTEPARKHLEDSLQNLEAHRFAILEEGMKLNRWTIPPDDAQFLETRVFEVAEVARWFNITPHKLADLSHATFSNVEHLGLDFVVSTLRPWLVRWEQEIKRKLVAPLEQRQQFAEHLVDGLLRGDIASRYNAYAVGRQWGWLSVNRILELENMNPIGTQGDVYLMPTNMMPADKADQIQPPGSGQPAPAPQLEDDDRSRDYRVIAEALAAHRRDIETVGEALRQAIETGRSAEAEVLRGEMEILRGEMQDTQERALVAEQERTAAAEARQAAFVEAVDARLAKTEESVKESVGSLREGAARTAQRVQDRLATVAGAAQERQRYQQDRAGILASCRLAINDAMRRVLHREGLAARKAATTPDKLRAWAETFYSRRQPMTDAVMVAMHLHGVLTRSTDPAAARAEGVIAAHCQRSRSELDALLAATPADLAAAVEALTARWEQDRPGQVAEELMGEVTANVE